MAKHFLIKSLETIHSNAQTQLEKVIEKSSIKVNEFALMIEDLLLSNQHITELLENEIHLFGENTVENLTKHIIEIYPYLGVKASKINDEINQIFRDYFTATQHKNFRKNSNHI